ncbi:hypothetical protein V8J88_03975 [Massilia sp. W12]|uniref:ParB/RepB/Spo0J family partition protein n=1 Tax=Massilia sp. W12 TaxID=3126507 RepID=UPI0030CEEDC6
MTKPNSFRKMIDDKTMRRANAQQIELHNIFVEPGFNPEGRILNDEEDMSLMQHIADGGSYPPLEVRPRAEGGVWIVDGHRRRHAIQQALDKGLLPRNENGSVWVHVALFEGNDVDRVLRIATSSEGRKLTPIQQAEIYKRLSKWLTLEEIAKKTHKSEAHIRQMQMLANANHDVQNMVKAGEVSATEAVRVVREHGENAGHILQEAKAHVKDSKNGRITAAAVKKAAPPPPAAPAQAKASEQQPSVPAAKQSITDADRLAALEAAIRDASNQEHSIRIAKCHGEQTLVLRLGQTDKFIHGATLKKVADQLIKGQFTDLETEGDDDKTGDLFDAAEVKESA